MLMDIRKTGERPFTENTSNEVSNSIKHVVIIANTSWFVSNFFASSIREFQQKCYRVTVLAPFDAYSHKLEEIGCEFCNLEIDRSGGNPLKEFRTILEMSRLLRKLQPDAILSFTPKVNIYTSLVMRLLKLPHISTVSGLGAIFTERGLRSFAGKLLLRLSQRQIDHVVFQNPDDHKLYLERNLICDKKTSRINGIGIDLDRFKPHQDLTGKPNEPVRFLLFARLLKSKGVELYVEAAEATKQALAKKNISSEFSLLGFVDEEHPHGIQESTIQSWHNAGHINYLGSSNSVESIIAEHDCIVLPTFYREGMPQSLMEASAMAKPIITTNFPGSREVVDHGITGLMIRPKSLDDLVRSMSLIAELSPEDRAKMGLAGRAKAELEFCHTTIASHYIKQIELLTQPKRSK